MIEQAGIRGCEGPRLGDEERRGRALGLGAPLIAVATVAEALPLLGLRPRVTGMGRRTYDFRGCTAVVSAGFAGACQSWLRPADLLLAGRDSPELQRALSATAGEIRTVDRVLGPAAKAALGRQGAAAVDMETAWLARAAAADGLPFLALRVIVDRLEDRPVSVMVAAHYVAASRRLRQAVRQALRLWP